MNGTKPQWSDLTLDLLAKIAKHLCTRISTLRFRAVCQSFRCSAPLPPKLLSPYTPLKLPYLIDPNPSHVDHLLITQSTMYAIKPLDGVPNAHQTWVVNLEESNSGNVQFNCPQRRYTSKFVSDLLPKSLNLLDYRVEELASEYTFAYVGASGEATFNRATMRAADISKVIVSKCLNELDDEFAIMAMHSNRKVSVWRYGDEKWMDIGVDSSDDIVYFNNKFYCLDKNSKGLISVDPLSLEVIQVALPRNTCYCTYLVNSFKDLLMIEINQINDLHKITFEPVSDLFSLNVFKFDEEKLDWVRVVDELEERALFLKHDCSFTFSAKVCPGCKNNCVYISAEVLRKGNYYPGCNVGIYSLKDDNVQPLSTSPYYSNIFWPPPTWLKQDCSSHY